ncbi:MAG: flagellar biosynthesis protein FlgF [Candidatus Cloacimonadota bacterium]|nr:MAG: flagellar biosynthesis protein FlgF [Candidatus Cloacimonadota bacterium]
MIRSLHQNSSAMQLLLDKINVTSNNLANVNTAGFKKKGVFFQQLTGAEQALARDGIVKEMPAGQIAVYTDYSVGKLTYTGNSLDIALQGEGFFTIETPEGDKYTRNGNFSLDSNQNLVTAEGFAVKGEAGPVKITGNDVVIGKDGTVQADGEAINKLMIKKISNDQLVRVGSNFYVPKEGAEVEDISASGILQGYLELSNINIVSEMTNMIATQRHYEANSKVIKSADDTLRQINQIGR